MLCSLEEKTCADKAGVSVPIGNIHFQTLSKQKLSKYRLVLTHS